MRKSVYGRQLGRNKNKTTALFRGLISSLVENGRLITTLPKAKAIKAETEKLITKAKKGGLTNRRMIFRFLSKRLLVDRLVDGIVPNLKERQSGYLKILKVASRKGDNSPMAQISFVDELPVVEKPEKELVKKIKENKKTGEAKND